jgi:hypothetical protein
VKHGGPANASQLKRLSTILPEHLRSSLDDESISVIHAPEGYKKFVSRHVLKILECG